MLTHRSFAAHPVVRFIFLMLGSMAVEGPALDWASIHIKHHAKTDAEGDPYSPLDGFFHGLRWWQFDLSAYIIRLLEQTGLAWNVWRIPAERLQVRMDLQQRLLNMPHDSTRGLANVRRLR